MMDQSLGGLPELLTNSELARVMRCKPNSIHRRLCLHRSYYGLLPIRLGNGRLRWRKSDVLALLSGQTAEA